MFQKPFPDTPMHKGRKFFFIALVGLSLLLILPFVIMFLWNSFVPEVTHFSSINYKQALMLFVLSRLLFGGFRFGGRRQRGFNGKGFEWKKKWQNMSDEERIQFKDEWKKRCDERKN